MACGRLAAGADGSEREHRECRSRFSPAVSCGWRPRYPLRHLREGLTRLHWDTPAWPLRVTSATPWEGLFFGVFAARL